MKVCSGCYQQKDTSEFLSKNIIRATCNNCRNKNLNIKKRQRCEKTLLLNNDNKENARLHNELPNIIYEYLLETSGMEEFLEDELPTTLTEEERSKEIASRIVFLASEGDGYQYVYHTKQFQQKTLLFYYWCNIRIELKKHSVKHKDLAKQRNTDPRIQKYACDGYISIKIDYQNNLIFFKLEHILHIRPDHIEVTNTVKEYIHSNIRLSALEIFYRIKEQKLPGYEMLTKGQVYYWWTREAALKYKRDNDEVKSAKLLLEEKGYSIIFQTNKPKSFAFITPFFSQLSQFALKTLVTDATYNTNSTKYELYGIMGVVDGTSFPLSYLLVSVGKNRPITEILMDMAQINAAMSIWPNAHVQLCLWHVRRNGAYPLIFQSDITIWQEIEGKQPLVMNEFNANSDVLLIDNSDNEDSDTEFCENVLIKFKNLLKETQDLLDESINLPQRKKWIENISSNFIPLERMVQQIKEYKCQFTMPRTWKGKTKNTFYWQ
ncbi:hypothetical protein C1646_674366 [Rhizophagus diaphanus]|nr:hypothetical protein C1646_674366 [Rhizophagus diaphanus] [Rhizophagus sp. MUCL 43196]